MISFRALPLACLSLSVLFVASGCGGGEQTGQTLYGTVSLNGEPVDNGVIKFNKKTAGSTSVAPIQSNGSYEAKMSRSVAGIEPGEYVVDIESWQVEPGQSRDGKEYPNGLSAVPPEYRPGGEKEFTVSIAPNSDNEVDFAMTGTSETDADVETMKAATE